MAEESLRVVELERLQAHGAPRREEEGQVGHGGLLPSQQAQCAGKLSRLTERDKSQGAARLCRADPHRQHKERLKGAFLSPHAWTAMPAGSLPVSSASFAHCLQEQHSPRLSPDQAQAHLLLGELLGPLHSGVMGLCLQVDI